MGFLDRLLGREEPQQSAPYPPQAPAGQSYPPPAPAAAPARTDDEIAVERYRYLLRTAPPETIEQVHEEAFTKLTPEQRRILFTQLSENAPAGEQPRGDDPRSLAQAATRSEIRQPGTLERSFNGANRGGNGGMGFGSMVASSLLGTVAGYVIGSALVSAFLPNPGADQAAGDAGNDGADGSGDGSNDSGDSGGPDAGGDAGAASDGGVTADSGGGDWSGGSGDFGGGDFGGGDFGGGFDF
ncbi:hypothetical protein [Herbiconiux ginsengi]|uniref:Uncharacterized protein n=1 Tax=Herbiconiux ginsengi TaxID=381665 RepID=A0A1H3RQ05_9MICO|nr:hypothetical protein [Herbiconiux ginsengi]SDZ27328.1 hypothetical protein SAMN05216554_2956 [Herbiconiux ginsengi]